MDIPEFVEDDFQIDYKNLISGGEAIVYIGSHDSHNKVAIKKWHNNLSDKKMEKMLKREIQILMQNPNDQIIKVIGLLIKNSHIILVMLCRTWKLAVLKTVRFILVKLFLVIHDTSHKYDETQINSWIIKICRGLSHLHLSNIIHRDIKPSNILLGESYDDVKLSDFGIARSVADITGSLTKGIGTELYVALEMFKNENYTFSADIYSLSITIWEILHRRIPYDHIEYPSFAELYQMIISIGVRPQLKNDLPKEVSDLLKSCWDANVSKRPAIDKVLEFFENTAFSLSTSPVEKSNENFDTQPPIGKSSEKQTILLIGGIDGQNNDSLLMLENNEQNWKLSYIELLYGIRSHGAQFLNNNLYIFGGYNEEDEILNWTYKLSESLKWKKMADMNQKRSRISNSSVILNNQIWVCDGNEGNLRWEGLKSVEMYDPETDKWKYMKEMNESRPNTAAAVVNGKIFCSGSYDIFAVVDLVKLNSVECYDPFSDVWTPICNMAQKIWVHGAVEINGTFIVMGGYNRREFLKNVWALDTTDKNAKWIEKPSMYIPRDEFSIAKIDNKIFVCGGYNKHFLDSVEIFDGEVWRDGPKMPTYRSDAPAVVVPMSFARSLN